MPLQPGNKTVLESCFWNVQAGPAVQHSCMSVPMLFPLSLQSQMYLVGFATQSRHLCAWEKILFQEGNVLRLEMVIFAKLNQKLRSSYPRFIVHRKD